MAFDYDTSVYPHYDILFWSHEYYVIRKMPENGAVFTILVKVGDEKTATAIVEGLKLLRLNKVNRIQILDDPAKSQDLDALDSDVPDWLA